jgi:hypothetical protein
MLAKARESTHAARSADCMSRARALSAVQAVPRTREHGELANNLHSRKH